MAESESAIFSRFCDAISYGLVRLRAPDLKDEQKKLILAVYEGKKVFVSIPTGLGKSIYFQILPSVFDHKVVVVSPLIDLIVYQIQSLRRESVKVFIISSGTRDIYAKIVSSY